MKMAISAVTLVVLGLLAWQIWERAPGLVRGTFLAEFRFLVPVLAIFALLSVVQFVVDRVGPKDDH